MSTPALIALTPSVPTLVLPADSRADASATRAKTFGEKLWSVCKKVDVMAQEIFDYIQNTVWPYIEKSGTIAKQTFTIVVITACSLKDKLGKIIPVIGLMSGLSFVLTLLSIPGSAEKLAKNIALEDHEGTLLKALGIVVDGGAAVDYLGSFINSLSNLGAIPQIAFFSLIGLPLAVALLGYSSIAGTYGLIRRGIVFHSMPKSVTKDNVDAVKQYFDKKLGISETERGIIQTTIEKKRAIIQKTVEKKHAKESSEEIEKLVNNEIQSLVNKKVKVLKACKINILERRTDKKVVNMMLHLQQHLNAKNADLKIADEAVRDMRNMMIRKITLGSLTTASNMTLCATLVSALAFPGAIPVLVPAIALARAGVTLFDHFFNLALLDMGLKHRAWAKSAPAA